jgi:hypothetical protein
MAWVPPECTEIKYTRGHNNELRHYQGSSKALHAAAAERWREDLKIFGPLAHYASHQLGRFNGVPVILDCYLVGPIPANRK